MPDHQWLARIRARLSSSLLRNTLWMSGGFAARLGLQVVYFILVARSLKTAEYGVFAGALGLVTFLSPFVSWGSGNILIKYVSRDQSLFPAYWGAALITTLLSGAGLTVLACALGMLVLPQDQPITILLYISIGDFLGMQLSQIAGQAFLAVQQVRFTSFIHVSLGVFRLIAAFLFFLAPIEKTAQFWGMMYMVSGLLAGFLGYFIVTKRIGSGRFAFEPVRRIWREGFYFSVSISSQGVYNDIDKTLLLRLSGDSIAGAYAAAYRFLEAAFVPVRALIHASYPRFFQRGAVGMRESLRFALKLLPWAGGLGVTAALGLLLIRPLIPLLLGAEYTLSLDILPWLAAIPILRAFHYLAADSLTGADFQPIRSWIQIGIAGFNFVVNLWLIPRYGWLGAAWSSLLSDGLLAIILWSVALGKARLEPATEAV